MKDVARDAERWWQSEVEAIRIVTARIAHDRFDGLIDAYRNAALWMATAGEGLCGFVVLVNRHEREVVSVGFWNTEAAMLHSAASRILPANILRLGEQLAEPPTIEHYRLIERVVLDCELHEGRLVQLDRSTTQHGEQDAIRQFRHASEHTDGRPVRLQRAALLYDSAVRRSTALGVWQPMDTTGQREHVLSSANGVRCPQLLTSATSRSYEVIVEV